MGSAEDLSNLTLDGRYRLTRLLGAGGMGQVYEGMHELLDRKVAVKVLLPRYAYEAKFRERFLREAKAASKVRHPNVVQILDFGETPNGSVYFAMEFLEGRDLATMLREDGRLTWPRARHMLLQIASALGAAHERQIIHRDIKPANFFIINARGHREFIKVLDFGIAKITTDPNVDSSAQSLTGTGEVFGTAKYMAPEQAYGYSDDPRVDIYSVGVVAYQMLTGQVPFSGVSTFDIISRHVTTPPQPPRELEPSIPPAVEAIILRALAKRQEDRFSSMDEMEQALAAVPPGPGVPDHTGNSASAPMPLMVPGVAMAPTGIPPGAQHPATPGYAAQPLDDKLTVQSTIPQEQPPAPGHPAPGHPAPGHPAPPPGSGTSVMPTRLRAPSSMTPGEVAGGSGVHGGLASSDPRAYGADAESSGPGASGPPFTAEGSTSQMQRYGSASTAPVGAGAMHLSDTDAELMAHSGSFKSPSMGRGLALGLLATIGGGGLLLAVIWGLSSDDSADSESAAVTAEADPESDEPRVIIAKEPEPETSPEPEASPPEPTTPSTEPQEPEEPEPEEPELVIDAEPEPETSPEPTPSKNPVRRTSEPAPLTDKKVRSRLARKLERKCKSQASGSVTIELLVGTTGSVLSKNMRGVSSGLRSCLTDGLAGAKFPAGKTRKISVKVDF